MIGWRLKAALASAGAFLLALLGAFRLGVRTTKDKQEAEQAKNALETHKRIDARKPVDPDNSDDIVKRLRDLGGQ